MTTPHDRLAASYARTATYEPRKIAAQHAANTTRAASDGYLIPSSPEFRFSDCGISGPRDDRLELARLVAALVDESARFGRLYIHEPSRLGRWSTPSVWWGIEHLLRRHRVEVVYLSRGACGDTTSGGRG